MDVVNCRGVVCEFSLAIVDIGLVYGEMGKRRMDCDRDNPFGYLFGLNILGLNKKQPVESYIWVQPIGSSKHY